jgi:transposase
MRGYSLTGFQRSALVTLWAVNISSQQIATLTGCDDRTITKWVDHYRSDTNLVDKPRSGRPHVTDAAEDQALEELARSQPFTTPRRIREELEMKIAARTIRRRLNAVGLLGHIARIEHPFTEANIHSRLEFARDHERWSDDDWDRIIFADESYIYLGVNGKIWVQRPVDTAYLAEYMIPGQLAHPPKIGVFCGFTSQGVSCIRLLDGEMDARLYTDTMQQVLKPAALSVFPSGGWQYLHDNASYHTARASYTWFHNNGVDCIKLPAHSPDMNPIENLFNHWKRQVELRFPKNLTELRQICVEEWNAIPPVLCSVLVDSMHDRMLAVINAEGHKSGY